MRAVNTIASPEIAKWSEDRPRLRALLDYLPAVVAAIGITLLGYVADGLNTESYKQNTRSQVTVELGIVRAHLEDVVNENALLVRGLAGFVTVEPDISEEKFNRLAAQLMTGKTHIRNISAVPDLVVRYVYPRAGNEAAIGLDLRTNPAQRDAALRARDLNELVIAGPVELVQGGLALIARVPVFTGGDPAGGTSRFWGLISSILDLDRVYRAAGLLDEKLPIEIAIRGRDGSGPKGEIFFGRRELFSDYPVLADVALPVGSWQIAAIPKVGWSAMPTNQRLLQTAFWIAGILIVMPLIAVGTLLGQRRRAEASLVRTLDELNVKTRAAEVSEAKFAAAFEHSPLIATIARFDTGAILDVNEAFVRLTGIERYEAVGKNSAELGLFTEEQRNQFRRAMQEEGKVSGQEIRVNMRGGKTVDVRIYSQIFAIEETRYLLTLVEDVTKRKEAERTAEAAQARLKNAIETIHDGFALFDPQDRLITANSRYYRFFREVGRPLVPGKTTFEEIIRTGAESGLYKAALGHIEEYVEDRMQIHRSGNHAFEQELVNGSWLRNTERRTKEGGTVCSAVDITELKRREVELEHARVMADAANQAKSTFLSSMSHELRTPMNAILGFAQLLERGAAVPVADKQQQYARHILSAGNYLLELIDQVLELSKIEAGKLAITQERLNVANIIAHSLFMVTSRAKRGDVTLINRTEGQTLPDLWADSSRVRQILLNLLSNAIKYNREGGTVTVSAEPMNAQMLRIRVEDTGSGIASIYHTQIFEPFNRLGRETDGTEGSGIGLAISKQIAELQGGAIGFESEEEVGSVFWVDLPLAPALANGDRSDEDVEGMQPGPLNGNGRRLVLYVEDNASNLQLMEELIETIDDLAMVSAQSGLLALKIARDHKPDLIMLDINLPEMDGFEVLAQLRASPETCNIPVIAVTAAAMPHEIEKGLQAGFRDYITKPIDVMTVLKAIDRHMN